MCQAKPGPRCSNDTAKEWTSAHNSLKAIREEWTTAEQTYNQALTYHRQMNTPESQALLDGWKERVDHLEASKEELERKTLDAEYSFYSTPQGMERLKNKNEEVGQKLVNRIDGFMLDDGDWADVRYPEYANTERTFILQQAQAHRQRQTEAYNYVNHPNLPGFTPAFNASPSLKGHERYIAASHLISRAEAEKKAIESSLTSSKKDEEKALVNCYVNRNNTESTQALIAAKRSVKLAQIKLVYLNMHLRDLRLFSAQHAPREIIAQP